MATIGAPVRIDVSAFGARTGAAYDTASAVEQAKRWRGASDEIIHFSAGRWYFATNCTINGPVEFDPGAVLVPKAGVIITISGTFSTADTLKKFDASEGGAFNFFGSGLTEVNAEWFGDEGDTVAAAAAAAAAATVGVAVTDRSVPTGGRKVVTLADYLSNNAVCNVRDFAEPSDADDTAAIQRALDAATAGSGTVVFPSGQYAVSSRLIAAVGAGNRLRIETRGYVEILSSVAEPGVEGGILHLTGTATSDVMIDGLTITHSAAVVGLLDGINLATAFRRVTLRDVTVTGASLWGILAEGTAKMLVENCTASNNRYGGLGMHGCAGVVVTGGEYSSNGTTAPNDGYGISCASTAAFGPCNGVLVQGVTANWNKRKGIDVHHGHNVTINGNTVIGFESAGIYAVGESTSKDVKDIRITNNIIDGAGASNFIYGVEIGAFGATAPASGSFLVSGNTIRNTNATASSAIFTHNPTAGGIASSKVTITDNSVENGAASTTYIIRSDNNPVRVGEVIVANNTLHAAAAIGGIGILMANRSTVLGNTITVDSGTVTNGIVTSAIDNSTFIGNKLLGAATYTNPIVVFAATFQTSRGNQVQGSVVRDWIRSGITEEYGTAAPTSGSYARGSRVLHASPAVGSPAGWVCTVTGTPGTWVPLPNL